MKLKRIKFSSYNIIFSAYILLSVSALIGFYLVFNFVYNNVYLVLTAPDQIKVDTAKIQIPDINTTEFEEIINKLNKKNTPSNSQNIKNIF